MAADVRAVLDVSVRDAVLGRPGAVVEATRKRLPRPVRGCEPLRPKLKLTPMTREREDRWPRYFDRNGVPINIDTWGKLFENTEYQRLGHDHVGHYLVSTVWLGLDHGFESDTPVIFETMIFATQDEKDDDELNQVCTRYTSEAAALTGHQQTVQNLREGKRPWFLN